MEVGADNMTGGQESEKKTHAGRVPTEGMLRALKNRSIQYHLQHTLSTIALKLSTEFCCM